MYPRLTTAPAGTEAVPASPNFPRIEAQVLAYWERDVTFKASLAPKNEDANEFVFYDGPPFANGLPHYGHLLTGYAKDVVPRYRTMRGNVVHRRFGWDTHGLPAELEAMKQNGLTTVDDINRVGIEVFNAYCRESVLKYTQEWEKYVTNQARWVDFDNDYKTLDLPFMESVIWAFKELHSKGLVYEGFKVLPYCWNDQTPLSNHELRMDDDVYQDRQDLSVTVTFGICEDDHSLSAELVGVCLMAWTTTPWTLPTNFSCAVGPDVDYVVVDAPTGMRYLLAEAQLGAYAKELGFIGEDPAATAHAAVSARYLGAQLAGLRYQPLWDTFTDTETYGTHNAWQVLAEEYVTTGDGTGVVHQASAYGEDDQISSESAGIPVILSVDDEAKFLPLFRGTELDDLVGVNVFDANVLIVRHLRRMGRLIKEASYVHSYPHCWRCRKPLIYKAVSSWFVRVTDIKKRMGELNEDITWVPENVKHGSFGTWVSNARDWPISRNRFWGSPIPVWKSDDPDYPRIDVYGSLDELERDFGVRPTDLHRPHIDHLTRPNPDDPTGQSTMRRVPEVLDCWFESGSMPFAQVHYPFENAEWFDTHFPGDFIVEYVGQTRGWFYTLHILSTALFDRPAFKNCVSHGIVLGDDGQKMSKSLRNYPDVQEVFDRDGADAMRWFLMASPILRGGTLIVTEAGIRDTVRTVLLPLWSTYYFFTLYANACHDGQGIAARTVTDAEEPLDRYLLALTGQLVHDVANHMDSYNISGACETIRAYLESVTNWYVRRSRDRFWAEDAAAFDVLYTALETVCRVSAPLMPLITEEIWRGLTGERSVHLTTWPEATALPQDPDLLATMSDVRAVCSAASSLRKARNLRVRLPLPGLTVVTDHPDAFAQWTADLIADEVNVQNVHFLASDSPEASAYGVTSRLTVNARAAGPRLGKDVQTAIKGAKTGDWSINETGTVTAGGLSLHDGEYTLDTVVGGDQATTDIAVAVLPTGGFVVLDTAVTPELQQIGLARDVIRVVQQARRDADLNISDRITLTITGDQEVWQAITEHTDLIMNETLAVQVGASGVLQDLPIAPGVVETTVGEEHTIRLLVSVKE